MVQAINSVEAVELISTDAAAQIDIIDVRDHAEFDSGHIPGARSVPLEEFRSDPERFLTQAKTLLFVCAKGVRSLAAAKIAERLGFANVYNMDGGTKAWSDAGFSLAA